VWGRDCGAVADGLRAVFVGGGGGVVCAIDLMYVVSLQVRSCLDGLQWWSGSGYHRTFSIASLTRSDLIRLFLARLLIRLSLVVPELRQAIVNDLLESLLYV